MDFESFEEIIRFAIEKESAGRVSILLEVLG
jgi:hypothetical protein